MPTEQITTVAVDTTVTNVLEMTIVTAAGTTSVTVHEAFMEQVRG